MKYLQLPVHLNDLDIQEKANILACAIKDRSELEAEKRSAANSFKDKITDINGEIQSLARCISTRTEYRSIGCQWERDNGHCTMMLVRQDTGEIVETRKMTDEERQVSLFPVETPELAFKSA